MINSVGRALVCRAGSRRDRLGERSKRSVVQYPGPSRREEQEFAGLISGTEWEVGARGRLSGT